MLIVPRLRSSVMVNGGPAESWHRGHWSLEASTMEEIDVTGKNGDVCDSQMPGTELGGTSPGQNVEGIVKHLYMK